MRILNREIPIVAIPKKILMIMVITTRAILLFKKPLRLLWFYINSLPLPEKIVEFRNGHKIYLSSYAHDLVTVMVLFSKREYGDIPVNSIVIDIGANIGTFSLYAVFNGAKRVFAFEPNLEAFEILNKNINENGFKEVITTYNLAVSDKDGDKVRIPVSSNPNNTVITNVSEDSDTNEVDTISLSSIIKSNRLSNIDLVKMDCEGAEYNIVGAADEETYRKIKRIRFEYHNGTDDLTSILQNYNYNIECLYPDNSRVGRVFYKRKS